MKRGIYIHVPFCAGRCPYCDFYSTVDLSLADEYVSAVSRELGSAGLDGAEIDSVYFGGGTPSLISARQLERLLTLIPVSRGAEITMEANPDDITADYMRDVRAAGINRLSVGVQSLDDGELAVLGRRHKAKAAKDAVLTACEAGFGNISADIMLGLPNQGRGGLEKTLSELTKLPLTHISAYILTLYGKTPFGADAALRNASPDEDIVADAYLRTVETLESKGFLQYEISNFAKKGFNCRHNLKYWDGGEYFGIGPRAHSHINGVRFVCDMTVEEFIAEGGRRFAVTEKKAGGFIETAMLRIRLVKSGFDLSAYPRRRDEILKNANPLAKAGLLNIRDSVLTLTPKGCLVSNEIIVKLFMRA